MHSISFLILLSIPSILAHSWIEQMQLISSNGSYAGDYGYPRGYVARTDPTFNGYSDKWQLPSPDTAVDRIRINSSDYLCHTAQRTSNYTSEYPKLQVAPDTWVALRYLENGHVTQPWIPSGKPGGSGTVFVYGTYSPATDEKIVDVLEWTTDGTGGNGEGFLMTAQDFDDERCHQPNDSPLSIERQMEFPDKVPGQEAWCETDLHIPANSTAGATLTLYWVWSWQTKPYTEGVTCGKDEYYTSCVDVDIVSSNTTESDLFAVPEEHSLVQQDPQTTAVSYYQSRTAIATTPNIITTEGCNITSYTTSSLPATLTEMTSLPAEFWSTYTLDEAVAVVTTTSSSSSSQPTASSSSSAATAAATTAAAVTTTAPAVSVQTVTVTPSPSTTFFTISTLSTVSLAAIDVVATAGTVEEIIARRANHFVA